MVDVKRTLCCLAFLSTLASGAFGVDRRPRLYLEQVQESDGKRWFAGVMADDKTCIETAIDLNAWIMRSVGETGIHYACRPELEYRVPAVDPMAILQLRMWMPSGEEKVQGVGRVRGDFCPALLEAKTQAYQHARFPLRHKFECGFRAPPRK